MLPMALFLAAVKDDELMVKAFPAIVLVGKLIVPKETFL